MVAYTGPCIECGVMNHPRHYIKNLCDRCYKRSKYVPSPNKTIKYTGPCINCGTFKSGEGRFFRKMCKACYGRMKTTGNIQPRTKDTGPCIKCGSYKSKAFVKGLCRSCYRKSVYVKRRKQGKSTCKDCNAEISAASRTGQCQKCRYNYRIRTEPGLRAAVLLNVRKQSKTPKGRESSRHHVRKRRAIMAQVESTLTREQWKAVLKKFDYRCAYCHQKKKLEMDHIIPISKGGSHTVSNVAPACRRCNSIKNNGGPLSHIQPLLL